MENKVQLKENLSLDFLVEKAVESLLYEVSISPKAGLVTRNSNGSHKDMNFKTFQASAYSLENYFKNCTQHCFSYKLKDENFFLRLRELGKKAEADMFKATAGINTHKGTIFSLGILIAVLSAFIQEKIEFSLEDLRDEIIKICSPLEYELKRNIADTNGERIFQKYGLKGARGLALSGYRIVLNDGILKLKKFLKFLDLETSCILLLFYYISVLDDTNIVSRSNIATLNEVKKESSKIFKKYQELKNLAPYIKKDMEDMNKKFIEKNISPGGSADLLILTIFLHFIVK